MPPDVLLLGVTVSSIFTILTPFTAYFAWQENHKSSELFSHGTMLLMAIATAAHCLYWLL
jgi:hypothetical protein